MTSFRLVTLIVKAGLVGLAFAGSWRRVATCRGRYGGRTVTTSMQPTSILAQNGTRVLAPGRLEKWDCSLDAGWPHMYN